MHCITKQTHNWILQCAKSRDPGLVLPLTISVYDLLSHSGSGNNDKAYAAITWHNDPASLGLESRLADHSSQAATNSATGAGSPGEFIMLHFWAFLQHHLWQMRDHWCVAMPRMSDLVYSARHGRTEGRTVYLRLGQTRRPAVIDCYMWYTTCIRRRR